MFFGVKTVTDEEQKQAVHEYLIAKGWTLDDCDNYRYPKDHTRRLVWYDGGLWDQNANRIFQLDVTDERGKS